MDTTGGAIDIDSGVFTAPGNGVYRFTFRVVIQSVFGFSIPFSGLFGSFFEISY